MSEQRETFNPDEPSELLLAMRSKCLQCFDNDEVAVKMCGYTNCPLYEYRFGVYPGWVEEEAAK